MPKQRVVDFVTRDARTRRVIWEEICLEMGYACSVRIVKNVIASIRYRKQIPRRKFNIRPYNKPLRVAWCQERLHWTYEEWKRVLWTDESSFSTAGFGHRPWVIRRPYEQYHADCIDGAFRQGGQSKMVWGRLLRNPQIRIGNGTLAGHKLGNA